MIGNLKGNLEMCLSARLGTSANIGELDHCQTRRALLNANLTLLGLQALLISSLAAFISFMLGLLTTHRVGDGMDSGIGGVGLDVGVGVGMDFDPGLAVGEQDFREGYTRPGWKQLVMVLATGMGAAGLSSAVLGTFMGYLIILSRWAGIDPGRSRVNHPISWLMSSAFVTDNITAPVAACLGDFLTVFILALLGAALVGAMDTPLPLIAVIAMSIAAAWFTQKVLRNEWVRKVAKGGWLPLVCAVLSTLLIYPSTVRD
jgi:solute carrier family 41